VDVFVKRGSAASPQTSDCAGAGPGNYSFCEIAAPQAGQWFIQVRQSGTGAGEFQLVVTQLGPRP
jgi:hypothetical protein